MRYLVQYKNYTDKWTTIEHGKTDYMSSLEVYHACTRFKEISIRLVAVYSDNNTVVIIHNGQDLDQSK